MKTKESATVELIRLAYSSFIIDGDNTMASAEKALRYVMDLATIAGLISAEVKEKL